MVSVKNIIYLLCYGGLTIMAVNKKTSDAVTTKNNTPAAETKKVETAASLCGE